jgi:hypothetical protein
MSAWAHLMFPGRFLMPSIVSSSFSTAPPLPATANVRDFRSNVVPVDGQILHQIVHLSRHAPASEAEHREHQVDHHEHRGDAADPQRSSAVTGRVKTNVKRIASVKGTKTACAQYRTITISTQPANVTHGFEILTESSTSRVLRRA